MNFVKKFLPVIIAAIVFGIGGYFIGVGVASRELGASIYDVQSAPIGMKASWDCKKNPNKPECKGIILPSSEDTVAMVSWFCQKNPTDPKCTGALVTPNDKIAMVSWFCQNNPKDPRCSQNGTANFGTPSAITLGTCLRIKGIPQTDAQENYSGCISPATNSIK